MKKKQNKIDWNRFNWEKIFGVVSSVDGLKRNQTRTLRTEIIELAIDKYSDGQLEYVGDTSDGMDFKGIDGLRYECKSAEILFPKIAPHTSSMVLKNHRSQQQVLKQTFDYMILVDTGKNRVGICEWSACKTSNKDAVIMFKALVEDITVVADGITPDPALASLNMANHITSLIRESI
jgi:hypothetical protein